MNDMIGNDFLDLQDTGLTLLCLRLVAHGPRCSAGREYKTIDITHSVFQLMLLWVLKPVGVTETTGEQKTLEIQRNFSTCTPSCMHRGENLLLDID